MEGLHMSETSGAAVAPLPLEVSPEQFRSAMASFATGITVVTTLDASGSPHAMTATAFTSVSLSPPRCLICLHKRARPHRPLLEMARFAVNILSAAQEDLVSRFASPVADRFHGVVWNRGELTGCPIIDGALACMECEVAEVHPSGDHDIIIGELRSVQVREGAPLVYFRGSCAHLRPSPKATEQRVDSKAVREGPAEQRKVHSLPSAITPSQVPDDLVQYITNQRYGEYSPEQHDVWREVLRRNRRIVGEHESHVHPAYVYGMRELDLPERIPRVEELNERLAGTGWSTVCVDGYVPSRAYARLMAHRIFPVSRQIRNWQQLDFAPAPDLVHDVVGHLAMLYLPEHRDYLRRLSEVMTRADANRLDEDFYASSVRMADLRWNPSSPADEVAAAEAEVASIHTALVDNASELTHLRRLYVWSVEFGLMGTSDDFCLFGAAFFSSPTEFLAASDKKAPILPYGLDVIDYENAFSDLLSQYFVTPGFAHLERVLDDYAATMRLRSDRPHTSEIRGILPIPAPKEGVR